jgi:hypothetical protein
MARGARRVPSFRVRAMLVARLAGVPGGPGEFHLRRHRSRQPCSDTGFPDGPRAAQGIAAAGLGGRASGGAFWRAFSGGSGHCAWRWMANGRLDLAALEVALSAHDPASGQVMLALQLANNETGVVQPVREAAAIVKAHHGLMVVDAVQAAGRLQLSLSELGADFLILSGHKIGGPNGVRSSGERRRNADASAADHRRRTGKGPSRRHRKPCRYRRLWRCCGSGPCCACPDCRSGASCATGWKPGCAKQAPDYRHSW